MTDLVPVSAVPSADDERWQRGLALVGEWLDLYQGHSMVAYSESIGWPWSVVTGNPRDTARLRAGVTWLRWCQANATPLFDVHRTEAHEWIRAVSRAALTRPVRLQLVRAVSEFYRWACIEGYTEVNPAALVDVQKMVK